MNQGRLYQIQRLSWLGVGKGGDEVDLMAQTKEPGPLTLGITGQYKGFQLRWDVVPRPMLAAE